MLKYDYLFLSFLLFKSTISESRGMIVETQTAVRTAKTAVQSGFYPRALYTFGSAHFLNDLVTTGMVPALVVLYKDAFNLNYTQSTLIVLISYLTSSITQPVFGMLSDRKPRVWLFSLGVFLSIAGLALTGVAPNLFWLLVFIAISGFGSGVFHPEASRGICGRQQKGLPINFQVGGNAGQAFGRSWSFIPCPYRYWRFDWLLPVAFLSLFLTVPLLRWMNGKVKIFK